MLRAGSGKDQRRRGAGSIADSLTDAMGTAVQTFPAALWCGLVFTLVLSSSAAKPSADLVIATKDFMPSPPVNLNEGHSSILNADEDYDYGYIEKRKNVNSIEDQAAADAKSGAGSQEFRECLQQCFRSSTPEGAKAAKLHGRRDEPRVGTRLNLLPGRDGSLGIGIGGVIFIIIIVLFCCWNRRRE